MILWDVNLLLYAAIPSTEHHHRCRTLLQGIVDDEEHFAVSELILAAVVRIGTNPRVFNPPANITAEQGASLAPWRAAGAGRFGASGRFMGLLPVLRTPQGAISVDKPGFRRCETTGFFLSCVITYPYQMGFQE